MSATDACSVIAERAATPAAGSAPLAGSWVALEQNGPWGREAAVSSHLPVDLGREVDRAVSAAGGRFTLVRSPGGHPDAAPTTTTSTATATATTATTATTARRCLVAFAGRRPWLLAGTVPDPRALLGLDLAALAAGDRDGVAASCPQLREERPVLLVCTNGRRDVCCAVRGRPVALDAAVQAPGRVWECSHTGGHRFAPTGVLLPSGRVLARLTVPTALAALDGADAGELPGPLLGEPHDRGASRLPAPAQVAESAVRARLQEMRMDALDVEGPDGGDRDAVTVAVRHVDGRRWTLTVERRPGPALPQSCGADPLPAPTWVVTRTRPPLTW